MRRHFPGKHCVSGVYFLYHLTKPVPAKPLSIKNPISFQAFCVSQMYYRDGFGPGISLHLFFHDDNQQKREKLSQLADHYLYITPTVLKDFLSPALTDCLKTVLIKISLYARLRIIEVTSFNMIVKV